MQNVDIFREVYADLRFPLLAVDMEKLRNAMRERLKGETKSHFAISLRGFSGGRRAALIASWRGLISKIDVP